MQLDLVIKKENGIFLLKNEYERGILNDLSLKGFDLDESIKNPLDNLLRPKHYKAYPIFNNKMDGRKMIVEQGWSHLDRSQLFAHFSQFLGFQPVPILDQKNIRSNREKYPYPKGLDESTSVIEDWDDGEQSVLNALKQSLVRWLGEKDTEVYDIESQGYDIKEPQIINPKAN